MSQISSYHALAARLRKAAGMLEIELVAAEAQTLAQARNEARSLSRGPYTSAMLRAMGHPYSRKSRKLPMHSGVINRQTGRFENSWVVHVPRRTRKGIVSRLYNRAPYSGYLASGTKRMIKRSTVELIYARIAANRRARIARAFKRAFGS